MNRPRPRACVLIAALLVFGCDAGPGLTTAPTPGGTALGPPGSLGEPTTAPTTAPAASNPSLDRFRLTLDTRGPVIGHDDGPRNTAYALPAAAARARDGTFVLLVVWFPIDNGPPVRTVARSDDGRAWTIDKTPILTDLGVGGTEPGPIPTALLQLDDGSWQLYGWADDPARSPHFTSWRARAKRLGGPWTLDGAHVLDTGQPGSWDSQTAGIRSVVRTGDELGAWYEGSPPGSSLRGNIGYAISTDDGQTWQKYDDPATTSADLVDSDPALRTGVCGGGTSFALFQPHVEHAPNGFEMVFGGFGRSRSQMDLFAATSLDGAHWTCGSPDALLRASGIPGSEGIHTFSAFLLGDGRMGLLIESLGEGHSDIWFATVDPIG